MTTLDSKIESREREEEDNVKREKERELRGHDSHNDSGCIFIFFNHVKFFRLFFFLIIF